MNTLLLTFSVAVTYNLFVTLALITSVPVSAGKCSLYCYLKNFKFNLKKKFINKLFYFIDLSCSRGFGIVIAILVKLFEHYFRKLPLINDDDVGGKMEKTDFGIKGMLVYNSLLFIYI